MYYLSAEEENPAFVLALAIPPKPRINWLVNPS